MNLKPLSDRVVVKPLEEEVQQTSSGIIIPDTAKEKPQEGEVVAIGPGKVSDSGNPVSMTVKSGDKVLYGKYSGTDIKFDNQDYLIMRESDILAIIS